MIFRIGAGYTLPFWDFLAGLGFLYLSLLFYLALTFMLGALFHSRGPVIGIPMLLIFGYQLSSLVAGLGKIMPWNLVLDLGANQPSLAIALVSRQPLPAITPIIGTIVLTLGSLAVAFWRFQHEEF